MQKRLDNKAFTFIELIVVIIIIWILWAIGFTQFVWNISNWRDSLRKSNLSEINWAIKSYKLTNWTLPIPSDTFSITNSWKIIVWQWKLWKNIWLSTIEEIPVDPIVKTPYLYSVTNNRWEFQIWLTIENWDWDFPLSLIAWNYKSVSKNILPTILIATWTTNSVEINSWTTEWAENRKLFIFNEQNHNLTYNFDWNTEPISDWTDFETLLLEAENKWVFSQNSSFETCLEITKAWKSIWDWEYQIRTNTWALTNTWCTWM